MATLAWLAPSQGAPGGWVFSVIFDLTGSYRAAFTGGAWNGVTVLIALFLLARSLPITRPRLAAAG